MMKLKQLAWSLWVLMVAVLVLEWIFLFGPMVRRIDVLQAEFEGQGTSD